MKRGLLAAVALLGLGSGLAQAQYVIVVVNVGAPKTPAGAAGQAGMIGMTGLPPAGIGGMEGAGGQMGGQAGQLPLSGAAGVGGFLPPGFQGQPGQMGQAGQMGQVGFMGTPPPMGGAFGTPPMGGSFGGVPAGMFGMENIGGLPEPQPGPPIYVMAVVEFSRITAYQDFPQKGYKFIRGAHKWGDSTALWGSSEIKLELALKRDSKNALPSVSKRFDDEVRKTGRDKGSQGQLYLAEWALKHGLIKECEKIMDELAKADPKNPSVVAFKAAQEGLKKKPEKDVPADVQRKLSETFQRNVSSTHFQLFHNLFRDDAPELKHRLDLLEESVTAFYYWHAVKGKALQMPRERMTSVHVSTKGDSELFYKRAKEFDSQAHNSESFLAPRQNVAVYSSHRLDPQYRAMVRITEDLWKDHDRDGVLKEKTPGFKTFAELEKQWLHLRSQTCGLIFKAVDESADTAAVTHEVPRQVLMSSGLVPANVSSPQWLQSGIGSLFQTPQMSPWRGYGAPHWQYYFTWKDLKTKKQLPENPTQLLKDVVSDKYFQKTSKRGTSPVKARATAWALTYYLAQENLDGLHAYFRELSKMPRDLDFDDEALLDTFCRAFKCWSVEKGKRDEEALGTLVRNWMSFMEVNPLDNDSQTLFERIYKRQNELIEEEAEANKPKPNPGTFPGGFPGGGPGGLPGPGKGGGP